MMLKTSVTPVALTTTEGRHSPVKRITVLTLFLSLFVLLPLTAQSHSRVQFSDTDPRQGSVVRVRLRTGSCRPGAYWNEERIPLHRYESDWIGYLGVGLETETGSRVLRIEEDCQSLDLPNQIELTVRNGNYPVQHLTVDDTGKVTLSEEALQRHRREAKLISSVLDRRTDERHWSAPFHPPTDESNFGPGDSFGSRRIINGHPRSPHSGEDYSASVGEPIYAIADGRVALTGNFFFSGKGVFVDHGLGVTSMYFHLSTIGVEKGQFVQAGQQLGTAGATGRVTGPHLHLGIQWRNARIDPDLLFFDQPNLFQPTHDTNRSNGH